jgi:hypothetical protein
MPKLTPTGIPTYRLHKQSRQAIVTLSGQDMLLGKFNSRESRDEYNRRIAEWLAAGRRIPIDPKAITVAEVVVAFRRHAHRYYADADGIVSKAAKNIDESLRPMLKLYAKTPAVEFGPLRLKAVQQAMIDAGHVRKNINRHITRVRSVFRWAAENELISPSVFHGLMAVKGLQAGRSGAVEGEPIKPVPVEYVDAVLPYVSPQVSGQSHVHQYPERFGAC